MVSRKPERRPARQQKVVEKGETGWTASLHVFVLVGFAVAQPLFDLLARQAEFFIFRQATSGDITALVVMLCVLLPLGLIGVEGIIGLCSPRLRRWAHGAIIAGGVAATVLPALHPISALPGSLLVAGAFLLGGMTALGYAFFPPVRLFFSLLSPAVLIFPSLFVFTSPVFRIVFPTDPSIPVERLHIANPPPIVFIILDELPLTLLLNEHHQIDAARYPHFAALAQHATWFRNTTTVSASTSQAVPAILTGQYPVPQQLPHATDHPHNLFSLLAGLYDLNTFGALTQLCPASLCTQHRSAVWQRLPSLLSDLAVVYLHLLLPQDLRASLPTISQNWGHFINAPEPHDRRAAQLKLLDKMMRHTLLSDRRQQGLDFIQAIRAADQPHLYFFHFLLPHAPYNYLPSGKVYTQEGGVPGLPAKGQRYVDDTQGVLQVYQRHLLQVGFVDTWLGALLSHLQETGLYDQTLLVITADHGVSFRPGDLRRLPTQTTFQDIMPVPLFIKAPFQRDGNVNDQPLETIDILPTLADILRVKLPWEIDGCSAFDPCSERIRRIYSSSGNPLTFPGLAQALERAVQRQHRLFGSGLPFPTAPSSPLLGKHLKEFGSIGATNVRIEIDRPDRFTTVDLRSDFVPAYISGLISPQSRSDQPVSLAVVVNGTIQAVTQPWGVPIRGRHGFWSATVPETAFQTGRNTVEVFVVSNVAGQITLARAPETHYRLDSADQTEALVSADGSSIPIVPQALRGYIETPQVSEHTVLLKGWAVDEKHAQSAEQILIFLNGTFYHAGPTAVSRPEIAEWLEQPAFATSGFRYTFPAEPFVGSGTPEVRVFAVSGSIASELRYIEGYPWKPSVQY